MQELGAPALFTWENPCITLESAPRGRTSTSGNSTNHRSCSRVGYIFLKEFVYLWICTVQTHAVQGPYNSIVLTPKQILQPEFFPKCWIWPVYPLHIFIWRLIWSNSSAKGTLLHFLFLSKVPSLQSTKWEPSESLLTFLLYLFYILLISRSSWCCLPDYVSFIYVSLLCSRCYWLKSNLHPVLLAPGH